MVMTNELDRCHRATSRLYRYGELYIAILSRPSPLREAGVEQRSCRQVGSPLSLRFVPSFRRRHDLAVVRDVLQEALAQRGVGDGRRLGLERVVGAGQPLGGAEVVGLGEHLVA